MDAISCLAPPPSALMDAAIAQALHFSSTTMSLSPDSSGSSSSTSSLSHHSPLLSALPSPYYAPPPPHATCCDSVLVADSPTGGQGRLRTQHHRKYDALAPRAGSGKNKRRSRASKRAPTTYITTDPANFRLMVQHVTGVQPGGGDADASSGVMLHVQATAALDAAALLAGNPGLLLPAGDDDDASALRRQHQLQLQQQPCFPTLDSSWNVVMYETNSAEML